MLACLFNPLDCALSAAPELWVGIVIGAVGMWITLSIPIVGRFIGPAVVFGLVTWFRSRTGTREPDFEDGGDRPSSQAQPKRRRPILDFLRGRRR